MGYYSIESVTDSVTIGGISQAQSADSYAQCIQKQGVASGIINNLTTALGVVVENDEKIQTKSQLKGTADASTINNGPFESIGEMFTGIFDGLGDLFGGNYSSSCLCIIVVLLLISAAIAAYYFLTGKSED